MSKAILALIAFASVTSAQAAVYTADQLTCAQVAQQVAQTSGYYKKSTDGVLHIYGLTTRPVFGGQENCTAPVYEKTVDSNGAKNCFVGYACYAN